MNIRRKLAYTIVLPGVFLLFGIYLPIIYLILLPFLISITMRHYIDSYFDRISLGVTIFATFNILVGVTFWIFNIPMSLPLIYSVHSFICICLLLFTLAKTPLKNIRFALIPKRKDLRDLPAIALAVIVFVLLFLPLVIKHNTNYVYQFFLFGGDNTAHLELTKVVEKNEGFLYEDVEITKDIITSNSTAYPQGLALNMYIIRGYVSSIYPIDSPKIELYFFLLITTLIYSLFSYVWAKLGLHIMRMYGRSRTFELYSILLSAVVVLGPFLHFYTNGFQTQLATLVVLGQMISLGTLLFNKKHSTRLILLILLFFLNIYISYTWLFLAPVTLLSSGLILLITFYDNITKKKFVTEVRRNSIAFASILIFIMVCFIQVYVQLRYGIKQDSINESGYIFAPAQSIVVMAGFLALLLFALPPKDSKPSVLSLTPFIIFCWVVVVFNISLYIYQLVTVGYPEYYYFKSAYHLILFGAVALPAILLFIGRFVSRAQYKYMKVVTGFVLVIAAAHLVPKALTPVLSTSVSNVNSNLINAYGDIINVNPSSAGDVISIDSCNRQQDFLITKLSSIIGDDNSFLRQQVAFSIIRNSSNRNELIKEYQDNKSLQDSKLILLDNDPETNSLPESIKSGATTIQVLGNNTKSACPNKFTGAEEPASSNPRKPF